MELKAAFADQEQTAMDIFNEDEVEVIIPLVEVAATHTLIVSEVTSREDDSSSNNSLIMNSIATTLLGFTLVQTCIGQVCPAFPLPIRF